MAFDLEKAAAFVKATDLRGTPRGLVAMDASTESTEVFDKAKAQTQIVGSGIYSFAQGVTEEVREAISDSALLAQLVANKKFDAATHPLEWFRAHTEVLQTVGWTLHEGGWSEYSNAGKAVEVHEKIIEVLTAVLGPTATAAILIKSVLDGLKAMKTDSPWITLFSREVQKGKIARFQIGLVEKDEGADVWISSLACLIEAEKAVTQVLFFRFKDDEAKFTANSAKVSVNRQALRDLGPHIRRKILPYQIDYVSSVLNI